MKALILFLATSLTAIAFSQRNGSTTFNGSVSTTTTNSNTTSDRVDRHTTTNTSSNDNNNNNNNSSSNYSSNNNSNWSSNNNSNSNWGNSNNNSYGNNYNNSYNNGYNNGYYNGYNNGYSSNYTSNNSNNYYNSNTQTSYQVSDNSYGSNVITEDKTNVVAKSNPYNITNMPSNYRNNTSIERFFKNNQKTSQTFIINAQVQNTLKGNDGTIVKIEPNSFVDKNGNIVKGEVEFELKEVYDKSAMVNSNAHTVSNDIPLISGGELFMGATQGDEPLMLASNKPIALEMPANSKEPMQLFNGKPDRNTVNWNLANTNSVTPVLNANSNTGSSYNFTTNSMNWINCDRFMRNNGNNTKMNVRLPQQYDTTNTAVFIVFAGQNTVTKFDHFKQLDRTSNVVNLSNFDTKWYSIPVGSDVTIVALSEVNGQYYSSMQRTVVVKDHLTDLTMQPTTLDQFKSDMEKLP